MSNPVIFIDAKTEAYQCIYRRCTSTSAMVMTTKGNLEAHGLCAEHLPPWCTPEVLELRATAHEARAVLTRTAPRRGLTKKQTAALDTAVDALHNLLDVLPAVARS